ncbi:MAG: ATP-binding protein [Planctomycetota bacterium]|jgi:NAD-dependent dihydropyrimidine dehydrogenase PreA subunit
MQRDIIRIDREKCDGCGKCVTACVEGAIELRDGKAELVSETYCDGLGACIGECPTGALVIEKREAPAFDEEAVHLRLAEKEGQGCPGSRVVNGLCPGAAVRSRVGPAAPKRDEDGAAPSSLSQWPVQLMLVPPTAPFLRGADLLISADCAPFAVGDFHDRYLAGRAVLVGCPKLDDLDYYEAKITEILKVAAPRSVTILRMEVPCCGGLAAATARAVEKAGGDVAFEVHTIGIEGSISRRVVTSDGGVSVPQGGHAKR